MLLRQHSRTLVELLLHSSFRFGVRGECGVDRLVMLPVELVQVHHTHAFEVVGVVPLQCSAVLCT